MEKNLNADEHRQAGRVSYVEPVVLIPREGKQWCFDRAFAVVTHDISPSGLSICNAAPLDGTYLIQLQSGDSPSNAESGPQFLSATTRHCTPLDFGFWLVGLEAEESVELDRCQHEWLTARIEVLRHVPSAAMPASE